ncbi:MAG: PepSY domain-containing protein [Ancalomicrobiaceae bacterium]|nr:PepSY domain-containing protein [Ancalomicrobiaceae bacterium]
MRLPIMLAIVLVFSSTIPALAESSCTTAPKAEWKPSAAAIEKASSLGYTASKVKEEDACWEVYAKNAKGEKYELLFNPVTLDLVRAKAD